ncbi:putative acyl-activating enzyme 17, peroxisomal, partial [Cucurbita argyrosperma subsp. sororia]
MDYRALDSITVTDIKALGIASEVADELHGILTDIIRSYGNGSPETWCHISKRVLSPDLPFSFHQMMYYGCYKHYGSDPPAWMPELESAVFTNVGQLLERRGKEFLGSNYRDPITSFSSFQEFSVSNPEVYWKAVLDDMHITFSKPPKCILQMNDSPDCQSPCPGGQWLPGAVFNPAKDCLSLNENRSLDDAAVIWRDEGCDNMPVKRLTLRELRTEAWLVAHALNSLGFEKGTAIAIDMPMNVTSVVIYLAIVLAGHVVVSIADSFAAREISTRVNISKAKAIFTQDLIIRGDKSIHLYSRVVDAQSPLAIVIPTRSTGLSMKLRDGDISWHAFLERVKDLKGVEFAAVEQSAESFTNILFSSGTTGEPKAIPWTLVTPLKAAADAWCHMDIHKGDVVAWPTNLGWMMGPWLVYASLLNKASLALYDGSPLGSGFVKFVQDAKVTMLGVVPSIVRSWKSTNCTSGYDWSSIRCFSSTGEASTVDECLWLMGRAGYKPVIEICGGTEIGGGFVAGSLLQAQALSAFSTPGMGCSLFILGNDGFPLPQNMPGIGELALGPFLFGASSTLLNADHYDVYFKGMPRWNGMVLRRHGDVFERSPRGYYRAHGRADDTMNLGGIKVSSVEIERICNSVDESILETAAIGKNLNPLFKVHRVVPYPSLPRTATNKVMRRILRQQLAAQHRSKL